MKFIQGELFKDIPNTDYFDSHDADFSMVRTGKIITHNSDFSTSQVLEIKDNWNIFNNSKYIWFSTNVDILHPRIIPIPIGLENPEWHPTLLKNRSIAWLAKNRKDKEKYLCMAMFNPMTHPSRSKVLDYFQKQPWCQTRLSLNGTGFHEYITTMANSAFAVCPRGNGIDTHRLWEALYVGTIPIVESCTNVESLVKGYLPAVVVDSFEEVTEELLMNYLSRSYYTTFNYDRLCMQYWEDYIQYTSEKLL